MGAPFLHALMRWSFTGDGDILQPTAPMAYAACRQVLLAVSLAVRLAAGWASFGCWMCARMLYSHIHALTHTVRDVWEY